MSVIPNMIRFVAKKMENCIICFLVFGFFCSFPENNNGKLFSPIVRGGGRCRGLLNLWKFADLSGLALLGVVTIEVHVRLGCLRHVFYFLFLGVGIDALDRISYRVGYIIFITTIIIALDFVRGLFLGIVFFIIFLLWVRGCWFQL